MVKKQQGFTLIELVVVIVILGILAAVAFPKFQDLSGSAKQAVVDGAAAALQSAAVLLFAKNSAVKQTYSDIKTNTTTDNITFTGNCGGAIVTYTGSTETKTVVLTDYCSG